jgi:hypothetical protein
MSYNSSFESPFLNIMIYGMLGGIILIRVVNQQTIHLPILVGINRYYYW